MLFMTIDRYSVDSGQRIWRFLWESIPFLLNKALCDMWRENIGTKLLSQTGC
jgi:hypothetical protein